VICLQFSQAILSDKTNRSAPKQKKTHQEFADQQLFWRQVGSL